MATSDMRANSTPGDIKKGEDVPSNLDAARPVADRIKDIDAARDTQDGAVGGGDTVIDNTPETAAEEAKADAKAEERAAEKPAKAKKGAAHE